MSQFFILKNVPMLSNNGKMELPILFLLQISKYLMLQYSQDLINEPNLVFQVNLTSIFKLMKFFFENSKR